MAILRTVLTFQCPQTGERIIVFRGHSDWVSCVTCAGPVVYTASKDKTLRAFEIAVRATIHIALFGL